MSLCQNQKEAWDDAEASIFLLMTNALISFDEKLNGRGKYF
jgi:hypothetical protein